MFSGTAAETAATRQFHEETRTLSLSKGKYVLSAQSNTLLRVVARDYARNWLQALDPLRHPFPIFRVPLRNISKTFAYLFCRYGGPALVSRVLVATKFSGKYSAARNFRLQEHVWKRLRP